MTRSKKQGRRNDAFPIKLHDMMAYAEAQSLGSVISWVLSGRGFIIYNPAKFSGILSIFFGKTKYKSFLRQLNMWNFERIAQGPNKGIYTHPYFVRGNKDLCNLMTRQVSKKLFEIAVPNSSLLSDRGNKVKNEKLEHNPSSFKLGVTHRANYQSNSDCAGGFCFCPGVEGFSFSSEKIGNSTTGNGSENNGEMIFSSEDRYASLGTHLQENLPNIDGEKGKYNIYDAIGVTMTDGTDVFAMHRVLHVKTSPSAQTKSEGYVGLVYGGEKQNLPFTSALHQPRLPKTCNKDILVRTEKDSMLDLIEPYPISRNRAPPTTLDSGFQDKLESGSQAEECSSMNMAICSTLANDLLMELSKPTSQLLSTTTFEAMSTSDDMQQIHFNPHRSNQREQMKTIVVNTSFIENSSCFAGRRFYLVEDDRKLQLWQNTINYK